MKCLQICAFVFISTVTLSSCTGERMTLGHGDRIIFLGDSITELGVKPNGYISLFREELATRHPDLNIEVLGAGVSGNKIPDLQNRLVRDVLQRKPTAVVIYIGINDVWHWNLKNLKGTTKEKFESGLREIIARIQYSGSGVILCTPTVIGEKRDSSNAQDPMLKEYSDISRKIAKDLSIELCDLHKAFQDYLALHNTENKEKGILTTDGVHLNDEGNKLVAQELLRFFIRQ
jgi:lysophospholipase L1-like esterase